MSETRIFDPDRDQPPAKVPVDVDEAAQSVFSHYLLPLAEEFSSAAIDAFLERGQSGRIELDRLSHDER